MIVYLDTSVIARALLPDEIGHEEARKLLADGQAGLVTGSLTRIEVASALTRAAHQARVDAAALVDAGLSLLAQDGRVSVVALPPELVESAAINLVIQHRLRTMDAWHLACAHVILPQLAEPREQQFFATRDVAQAEAARAIGLRLL